MNGKDIHNILDKNSLHRAWQKIKAKNSQFGIDKVSIDEFEKDYKENIKNLTTMVLEGKYYPEPYLQYKMKKLKGGFRPISLLSIKDKLLQTAVNNYYLEKINGVFSDASYAYRPNKGHTKAIRRVKDYILRKNKFFVHADIDNFFDTINRIKLIEKIKKYIEDETVVNLFRMWIETGVVYREKYINSEIGIAQGGVVSPLLSNIYLNDFDLELSERGFKHVRYSDNILLIAKTKDEAIEALEFTKEYLRNELKLKLNPGVKVKEISEGIDFLGISFSDGKLLMQKEKFEEKILKFGAIIRNNNWENIPQKISESIDGIKRYYLHFDTQEQLLKIAEHITEKLVEKFAEKNEINKSELFNIISSISLYKITGRSNNYFVKIAKEKLSLYLNEVNENVKFRRKIEVKSRRYIKEMFENLNLVVFTPFSTIGKSHNAIVIRNKGKIINEILISKIKNIIISAKNVNITSAAIKLAAERGIVISLIDSFGKPFANISSPYLLISETTLKQASKLNEEKGKIIVKKILTAKVKNQISILKFFYKSRRGKIDENVWLTNVEVIEKSLNLLKEAELEGDLNNFRDKLLGYEGNAASSYWKLFSLFIPENYEFTHRERKNAENTINILLNYGYGVLYNKIINSIVVARLNPALGFIHRGNGKKPVLAFDLIEPFRAPIVDRTVLAFVSRGKKIKITRNNFPDEIKKQFLKKLLERFEANFYFRNKLVNFNQLIIQQAKDLEKYITEEINNFKPYIAKW